MDDLRSTPRTVPSNEYPTTPTPPSRKSHVASRTITVDTEEQQSLKPSVSAGLFSSPVSASTSSQPRPTLITPKKPRPSYSGPIVDPNPVNPFAVTPTKSSPHHPGPSTGITTTPSQSPFLHATSPRKLRELLESNSLKRVKERSVTNEETTPRTRARKRLRGEVVGDTPIKDKVSRRKRGRSSDLSTENGDTKEKGKRVMLVEDQLGAEGEEEDEFGPSPMKMPNGMTRMFPELLEEATKDDSTLAENTNKKRSKGEIEGKVREKRGRPSEKLGMFGRVAKGKERQKVKLQAEGTHRKDGQKFPIDTQPNRHTSPPRIPFYEETHLPRDPTPPIANENDDLRDPEELPTPPPDPLLEEAAASQSSVPQNARREKIVSFSDDEEDEWDPEGGHLRRRLVITGTRRIARGRRDSFTSLDGGQEINEDQDEIGDDEVGSEPEMEDEGMDGEESAPTLLVGDGTNSASPTHPSSPSPSILAPSLLSLLSLRSPPKQSQDRLAQLRVKAIFNPSDAVTLRALSRGQDTYVSGEGVDGDREDDEGIMERYGLGLEEQEDEDAGGGGIGGVEGDDDWEEECEGWKRTNLDINEW